RERRRTTENRGPAARGLRGGVAIPAVFEGGATQPPPGSPTRQPRWGGAGMHRPSNGVPSAAAALGAPNAARLSPRAAKDTTEQPLVTARRGEAAVPPGKARACGGPPRR